MPSTPTYRIADGALCVPVDDEAIILSISLGKYFGIRGAMRHLLEELRDGLSFDEMVARTCARYRVGRGRAAEDLQRIVPHLINAGILEAVGSEAVRPSGAPLS